MLIHNTAWVWLRNCSLGNLYVVAFFGNRSKHGYLLTPLKNTQQPTDLLHHRQQWLNGLLQWILRRQRHRRVTWRQHEIQHVRRSNERWNDKRHVGDIFRLERSRRRGDRIHRVERCGHDVPRKHVVTSWVGLWRRYRVWGWWVSRGGERRVLEGRGFVIGRLLPAFSQRGGQNSRIGRSRLCR